MKRVPCRRCKEPMIFAEGAKGGKVPIDPDPVDDGNLVLLDAPDDGRLLAVHVSKLEEYASLLGPTLEELTAAPRYKSHFATCPFARSFQR